MKNRFKYTVLAGIALLAGGLFQACSDELVSKQEADFGEGAPLTFSVGFESSSKTRLAELPNADAMNDAEKGLSHVGLYIYYEDDYKVGDLSKPYIRNLECRVGTEAAGDGDRKGKLVPVTGEQLYIYDRMRVVAFYPYNKEMSNPANFFKVPADECAYPISKSIYADQKYIPYRAEMSTNPTIAYMAQLWFQPRQTAKIEIVLVADNATDFPVGTTEKPIQIVPAIDPVSPTPNTGTGYQTDCREKWLDGTNIYTPDASGKHVRQYVAYVWTSPAGSKHHDNETTTDHNHSDNIIQQGDVVFQSEKLTLTSSQTVNLAEQRVYRYGYNLNTGEVFIPTSSQLVYDVTSLQAASLSKNATYQACDIDFSKLTSAAWTPKDLIDASYDGGGHKISGFILTATAQKVPVTTPVTPPGKQFFGLFGKVCGNSTLRNINMVSPKLTITGQTAVTEDTCCVGSLCGQLNPALSKKEKEAMVSSTLPPGLSEVVKQALIEDLLKNLSNSTSQIIACRVEAPSIEVTGNAPRVGGLCGAAGDKDEDQNSYFAKIWDSYVLEANLEVNKALAGETPAAATARKAWNKAAKVGGFCGDANALIHHSYATVNAAKAETEITQGGTTTTQSVNRAAVFCVKGAKLDATHCTVDDCYYAIGTTTDADATSATNGGAMNFATNKPAATSWVTYTGRWPVYTNDWAETGGSGNHPSIRSFWKSIGSCAASDYPLLLWETN